MITKITKSIVLLAGMAITLVRAGSLEPLNDAEMGAVTGQNAIQLTVKMHNNVIATNDNNHVRGNHCVPDTNGYSPCRLGMEFVDKERNWLVMKQFYGYLNLTDIRFEGVTLPASNTAYHDPDRFKRADGSCMIAGCNPKSLAAIEMSYPSSKGPGQYLDMQTFLNIGAMVVETNNPGATYSDGSNPHRPDAVTDYGFMRDQTQGVANAFRISDSSGPNANMQVRFDGSTLIYGF
ncbi:hypothetical protein MWU49_12555 [Alcanivorax sp. S6407]|uniref:hypothetical protein n=1 Tax=Alcanivorax sp. S6407 TaxID=2926424 RepID=UPI001FF3F502|nr:hypothetical protein [Alcanivorax sp. S6407]MCK0154541.1 hypothetical protein [Alcanivorax sp. S6407]